MWLQRSSDARSRPHAGHSRPVPATLPQRAHALSPQAPERLKAGPGRCAPRCQLQLPDTAPPVPTRHTAPQPACAAFGFSGAYLGSASPGSLRAPRSVPQCPASPVGVVTAPRTARFLPSPPSHLPPNLLPSPAQSPDPWGRPLRLSSRPRPSLPGPSGLTAGPAVGRQRRGGG